MRNAEIREYGHSLEVKAVSRNVCEELSKQERKAREEEPKLSAPPGTEPRKSSTFPAFMQHWDQS